MLLLKNATVINGDGKSELRHGNILVDGDRIAAVTDRLSDCDKTGWEVIDCTGKIVIPGMITHHTHGLVNGPFLASGAPALSEERIIAQHKRHLMHGHTTALNVDGFCTMDEAKASAHYSPLRVKQTTVHLPLSFLAADKGDGKGLSEKHRQMTVERMLEDGAVAIGEVGAGQTTAGGDYVYIPAEIKERKGVDITAKQSMILLDAVLGKWADKNYDNTERVAKALKDYDLDGILTPEEARDIVWKTTFRVYDYAIGAFEEAVDASIRYGVPAILHHTPSTMNIVKKCALKCADRMICAHTHLAYSPEEAIEVSRFLKNQYGVLIDVAVLDAFGDRAIEPQQETLLAMFENDLVDLISTDYSGGRSDSMLLCINEVVKRGYTSLPKAIALATSAPAHCVPGLAVGAGILAPNYLADMVVVDEDDITNINRVYVGGALVVKDGEYLA